MTRLGADVLLLIAAAIWGLAFVFQKTAMDHVGPATFIAARGFVAALALLPLAVLELRGRAAQPEQSFLGSGLVAGTLFFIAAWLQQKGLVTASVTNAGFLTSLYVIATPFLVWGISGRAPGAGVWLAVALATVGTWALSGGSVDGGFGFGDGLVAASAVFWSLHMIVTGRATRHGAPITFTALQFATVAAWAAVTAAAFESPRVEALVAAWSSIAYVGLLSSALTFTLLAVAMKHTPAPEAAILVSTETLFAAIAGALLLGERLTLLGWAGAAAMIAATLVVQLAPHPKAGADRR